MLLFNDCYSTSGNRRIWEPTLLIFSARRPTKRRKKTLCELPKRIKNKIAKWPVRSSRRRIVPPKEAANTMLDYGCKAHIYSDLDSGRFPLEHFARAKRQSWVLKGDMGRKQIFHFRGEDLLRINPLPNRWSSPPNTSRAVTMLVKETQLDFRPDIQHE